jgi:UDP:flavonoid glycosyltransferase YjiC (YdhE family)
LTRLGVAASIKRDGLTPERVAARLRKLLDSKSVLERCRHYAAKFDGDRAVEDTCNRIESLAREPQDARVV